ncbi:aspartic peptidase domain-containing protein [Cercophora newfieldiana]|uniref:Aspartic peptidase domain-containing protein n=1 Tax=Cercophora newfieldiana TaxID=92897 RepID=A0AA39Y3W9_9PEZI|nr:aspartic peptidase domain-containing protein [Cercophora newfieldiana]
MRLPSLAAAVFCDILLLLAPTVSASDAGSASAVWIPSSNNWYGIDGNWSSFKAFVGGGRGQEVYLSVATLLSEVWVVQDDGCPGVQLCITARGGVFNPQGSNSWKPLGPFQLGMNYTGIEGNGDYGLDTVSFYNLQTSENNQYDNVVVAAINTTDYYQGFIGVGVNTGRFNNNLTLPLISQMAETYGSIPSHSYGYTAGAFYRRPGSSLAKGTPASLVFGGFDKTRFEPHNEMFPLDPRTRQPRVNLRGVTAEITSLDKAPNSNWTSTSQALVSMNDSISAIIDTSTPYLWLPTEVCDRFAAALNLTWREDLGVYVYPPDGNLYNDFLEDQSLSFTFSISGFDNQDNFGRPLNMPGVVNITLPSAAFAQVLRYPYRDAIKFGDSGIPYFPLKRSTMEVNDNQFIIGRAFMQEAYIITRYDNSLFSIHQAKFPDNAIRSYDLESISRPSDSIFPPYTGPVSSSHGLSTSQTVGIVLSAFASGSVIGFILWCCFRKRKKKAASPVEATEKDKSDTQSIDSLPQSPVKRMFTMIIGRKRSKKPMVTHEMSGNSAQPVEVGADAQHQLFELPVPLEPAELDSGDIADDDTEFASGSQVLSEYELARRKLERQLQGPVPTYSETLASSPTSPSSPTSTGEAKSMQDVSPVAHYRPPQEDPSPVSSPTYANTNSLPDCLPSPLSPHPEGGTRMFDFPSPMTVVPPSAHLPLRAPSNISSGSSCSPVSPNSPHSPLTFAPSAMTRSNSDNVSPTSPIGSLRIPPTPTCQRTPIDPTKVVCLGPLPENVALPNQQPPPPPIPQIVTPDGRTFQTGRSAHRDTAALRQARQSRGSNDSLGSNFTVDEEVRLHEEEVTRQASVRQPPEGSQPRSPRSMERIDPGFDLVHVPQVAEKRYSWEEN